MSELRLIEAVKAGESAIVKELLGSDEDVNQQDEHGWTPLNWAAGRGDLETVRLLVEHGADVLKVGRDQRTAYMIALAASQAEVARFLRQAAQTAGVDGGGAARQYCKAYYLGLLRQFPHWTESRINWKEQDQDDAPAADQADQGFSESSVVFLHQDYTVTKSMWHDENVIFNQVTPEWKAFCDSTLGFKVPDDLELIAPVERTAE